MDYEPQPSSHETTAKTELPPASPLTDVELKIWAANKAFNPEGEKKIPGIIFLKGRSSKEGQETCSARAADLLVLLPYSPRDNAIARYDLSGPGFVVSRKPGLLGGSTARITTNKGHELKIESGHTVGFGRDPKNTGAKVKYPDIDHYGMISRQHLAITPRKDTIDIRETSSNGSVVIVLTPEQAEAVKSYWEKHPKERKARRAESTTAGKKSNPENYLPASDPGGHSEIGSRDEQQDAFVVSQSVGAIVDGMGGYKGGNPAAGIIKGVVESNLKKIDNGAPLHDVFDLANQEIEEAKAAGELPEKAGATIILAARSPNNILRVIQAGDAQAFIFDRNGKLIQFTYPDSAVGDLWKGKTLTENQAKHSPQASIVNNAIKGEGSLPPRSFTFQNVGPENWVLLTCDGVGMALSNARIEKIVRNGISQRLSKEQVAKQLTQEAVREEGKDADNATAVII